jgi:hypothetical protein
MYKKQDVCLRRNTYEEINRTNTSPNAPGTISLVEIQD